MKKLSFVLAAALAIVGCEKEPVNSGSNQPEGICEITFNLSPGTTKVTTTDISKENEVNVSTLQVFVFNSDGSVDAFSGRENGNNLTLSCTLGDKTVYALVNAPLIRQVESLTGFLAETSQFSDNQLNQFVMLGSLNVKLSSSKAKVTIPVKRLVCKIVIEKITRVDETEDSTKTLSIVGMCLKHVAGTTNLGLNAQAESWYNTVTNEKLTSPDNVVAMTTQYNINSAPIANKETYATSHTFYAYPNIVSSTYPTILSIEHAIEGDDTPYYYPIQIENNLEANKVYTITELKLTRRGGTDDDKAQIYFTLKVEDWEIGGSWPESF